MARSPVRAGEADRERRGEDGEERDRTDGGDNRNETADEEGAEAELCRDQPAADDGREPSGHEPILPDALEEVLWRPGLFEPGEQAHGAQARAKHEVRDY